MNTTTMKVIDLINRDNKALLKNADTICFRLDSNENSQIECNKKIKVEGYETEVRQSISVGTKISIYEGYGEGNKYEVEKAFESIMFAKDDFTWQSIVKCLKKDDEVTLEWIVGNNNNILNENGLSCDTLNIRIKRNGKLEYNFKIADSITHKNSLARMVSLRKIY